MREEGYAALRRRYRRASFREMRFAPRSSTILAATAAQVITFVSALEGYEGLVLGFRYSVAGGDYVTNPVSFVTFSPQKPDPTIQLASSTPLLDTGGNPLTGEPILGMQGWSAEIDPGRLFYLPFESEIPLGVNTAIGIQVANGSGAPLAVSAALIAVVWSHNGTPSDPSRFQSGADERCGPGAPWSGRERLFTHE